jgi:hypothetical protein
VLVGTTSPLLRVAVPVVRDWVRVRELTSSQCHDNDNGIVVVVVVQFSHLRVVS